MKEEESISTEDMNNDQFYNMLVEYIKLRRAYSMKKIKKCMEEDRIGEKYNNETEEDIKYCLYCALIDKKKLKELKKMNWDVSNIMKSIITELYNKKLLNPERVQFIITNSQNSYIVVIELIKKLYGGSDGLIKFLNNNIEDYYDENQNQCKFKILFTVNKLIHKIRNN